MTRTPSPPAPSTVGKLAAECIRLCRDLQHDYREAWQDAYSSGSGAEVKVAGGTSDTTGDTVADKEHRRKALHDASILIQQARDSLRSALGLTLEGNRPPASSSWTDGELARAEAHAHDERRSSRRRQLA